MVKEGEKKETKIVLTKPLSLEGESDSDSDVPYKAPNILQRIISLFQNVRPGSDLTRFQALENFGSIIHCFRMRLQCDVHTAAIVAAMWLQKHRHNNIAIAIMIASAIYYHLDHRIGENDENLLPYLQLPPLFNFPKSQLQCYGESVYCTALDLLSKCNNGLTPLDRFISVVAWSISTTRPATFGVAPYNPILGETHHVSKGNLNVLLEQVSHHPPVTALHATDEKENIEMIWCQQPVPKFYGTSVEAQVHGKRKLKLLNHSETYEMNCPHLLFRILPVSGVDWVGTVNIQCLETGLVAELSYTSSHSFLGIGGNHKVIRGKILDSSSLKVLYEVDGHWDRTIKIKDTNNGKVTVIYDAKEVISGIQAPIVKDAESVWPTESAHVWSELSEAILNKDWEKARQAKQAVEERQRELLRERESKKETWIPKHFMMSYSKEGGWDCSPIHNLVSAAPITAQ